MTWIGVDIGGTFTDVIAYDPATRILRAAKSLSTPDRPVRAVLDGVAKLGVPLAQVSRFVHGTTRVTNALLEHSGARVALITTRGFRDVIEMGRGHRPQLYSVKERALPRLVERRHRFEVDERLTVDGGVLTKLDEDQVLAALKAIDAAGIGGVAICFLHAYRNPVHEQRAADLVRRHYPHLAVSTSAEVVPEIGEYERFATTVLNVSVKPVVDAYLSEFEGALAAQGYAGGLTIMTSSGGVVSSGHARHVPMQLALSGPAGGVAASAYAATSAGFPDLITCDMGGTSADVCLIKAGLPTMTNQGEIGGYPNKTFQVEINTIGAGGGSIAWLDVGGELCIGPQSAGSTPGPAAYGRGGTRPTTTDAHLLVGHLDPEEKLGGEVKLDVEASRRAMQAVADRLGNVTVEQLALGIIQLAVVKMTGAIKEISVARGHDPRDFALLPFGGAGPMHATALADELGMTTVLIPPVPGNLSALGFIAAQARHDLVRALLLDVDSTALQQVAATFTELEAEAHHRLRDGGLEDMSAAVLQRSLGMRIKGQSFDVTVPVDGPLDLTALTVRFQSVYEARYAYAPGVAKLEIVNCRVVALGPSPRVNLSGRTDNDVAVTPTRRVYTAAGWVDAAVYRRGSLAPGAVVQGPCIIRESGATSVIGAGWQVRVDALNNLVATRA